MRCHSYNANKVVTGLKKQNRVNFVPHFGHPKVYETFVWTHCFQILAKTMLESVNYFDNICLMKASYEVV